MALSVSWLFVLRFCFIYRNRTHTHHVFITSLFLASVKNVLWVLAMIQFSRLLTDGELHFYSYGC
jgi:hypothetical protein